MPEDMFDQLPCEILVERLFAVHQAHMTTLERVGLQELKQPRLQGKLITDRVGVVESEDTRQLSDVEPGAVGFHASRSPRGQMIALHQEIDRRNFVERTIHKPSITRALLYEIAGRFTAELRFCVFAGGGPGRAERSKSVSDREEVSSLAARVSSMLDPESITMGRLSPGRPSPADPASCRGSSIAALTPPRAGVRSA
eukprot:463392-Hanusia_phi.AAC.1